METTMMYCRYSELKQEQPNNIKYKMYWRVYWEIFHGVMSSLKY